MKYCPKCGKEIKDNDNYCQYCGINLSEDIKEVVIEHTKQAVLTYKEICAIVGLGITLLTTVYYSTFLYEIVYQYEFLSYLFLVLLSGSASALSIIGLFSKKGFKAMAIPSLVVSGFIFLVSGITFMDVIKNILFPPPIIID